MKGDSAPLIEKHISKVLELAGGRIPVYVFVSPRFTGQGGDHSFFVPNDVFLKQTNAAMKAVWVDEDGVQHKIQGLILWDTYKFSPESDWKELDQKHKYYFELLQALVTAWEVEMQGTEVITGLSSNLPYANMLYQNRRTVLLNSKVNQLHNLLEIEGFDQKKKATALVAVAFEGIE